MGATSTPSAISADVAEADARAGDEPLLAVQSLTVSFASGGRGLFSPARQVHAVRDVSLSIARKRTFGVVGESGCGKSTLARAILRLIPSASGRIVFDGVDLTQLTPPAMRAMRPRIQMIFQDPVGSLNPRMTVESLVGEALLVHGLARSRADGREQVASMLRRVGLSADDLDRFPHQFSGGQRQRIGIARALVLKPLLVICDEPVSALDVSIQSQILNLLADLQEQDGLTYLFIAHNLDVMRRFCDEIAVMYLGRIVEQAPAEALFREAKHPYTQALLAAAPQADAGAASRPLRVLPGEPPSPLNPPSGCAFHPRCSKADERCRRERPELRTMESSRHMAACHYA